MDKTLTHKTIEESLSIFDADTLVRVVYVSMITIKSRINPMLFEDIEKKATKNNNANDITGVLAYGNGIFLQCVEGHKSEVLKLLQRIFTDNRHKHIKILMCMPIKSVYFTDWHMRMLFCERWLWSSKTKKKAGQMLEFIPFRPHNWSAPKLDRFINAIKSFEATISETHAGMKYNTFGQIMQRVVGPHQAFLLVQSILTIMVIFSLFLMDSVF